MIGYKCKDCLWWDHEHKRLKDLSEDFGYCRKHKPIVYGANGKHYGSWPLVDKDDFCGEFRKDDTGE